MNLLIFARHELVHPDFLHLNDRRAEHLRHVVKVTPGQLLRVGELNGLTGLAEVISLEANTVSLKLRLPLDAPPPANLPATLIMGLPRPRMLQRSLQTIATMGVSGVHFLHTQRVEKSFWQTPLLQPAAIHEQLLLGLEQAKATQLPSVTLHPKWRTFVNTCLPELLQAHPQRIIAHPGHHTLNDHNPQQPTLIALGPEGGFVDDEVAQCIALGFKPLSLGERILRVETAVPVVLAKLF
jgi:16S rRNA (uracil1498-N3)-methyltransferase